MPQPALHVLIARDVLEGWRRSPGAAPFDPDAPQAANHFLHGALGPDMGFYPGCDSRISRLVHAGRSGQVARRLLETAETDADRAFAWGWITHVLADVEIHPHINAAAAALLEAEGRVLHGRRQQMMAHVRVEVGLDAWFLRRQPSVAAVPLRNAFDRRRISRLADALRDTYSVPFHDRRVLVSHRRVTLFYRGHLRLLALLSADHASARAASAAAVAMRTIRKCVGGLVTSESPVHAFVHALAPTSELLDRVHAGLARFQREYSQHVASRLAELPDFDLETGGLAAPVMDGAARTPVRTVFPPAAGVVVQPG